MIKRIFVTPLDGSTQSTDSIAGGLMIESARVTDGSVELDGRCVLIPEVLAEDAKNAMFGGDGRNDLVLDATWDEYAICWIAEAVIQPETGFRCFECEEDLQPCKVCKNHEMARDLGVPVGSPELDIVSLCLGARRAA